MRIFDRCQNVLALVADVTTESAHWSIIRIDKSVNTTGTAGRFCLFMFWVVNKREIIGKNGIRASFGSGVGDEDTTENL